MAEAITEITITYPPETIMGVGIITTTLRHPKSLKRIIQPLRFCC